MSEKRVDQTNWDELVRGFNDRYSGSDVSVTILDPEMGERYEMEPEPLLELATEHVEGIDRFDLVTGPLDHPFTHAVPWTRDVWVEDDETEEVLSIVGENGITTVLHCRKC